MMSKRAHTLPKYTCTSGLLLVQCAKFPQAKTKSTVIKAIAAVINRDCSWVRGRLGKLTKIDSFRTYDDCLVDTRR